MHCVSLFRTTMVRTTGVVFLLLAVAFSVGQVSDNVNYGILNTMLQSPVRDEQGRREIVDHNPTVEGNIIYLLLVFYVCLYLIVPY